MARSRTRKARTRKSQRKSRRKSIVKKRQRKADGVVLEWMKGTGYKKYKVRVIRPNGTTKTVQFGDRRYQHFKDKTPLKLYSSKDHKDPKRKKNYQARHGAQGHQKKKYSASWFAWNYLW